MSSLRRKYNWGCIGILIALFIFWVIVGLAIAAYARAQHPTQAQITKATALAQYVWHPECTLTMNVEPPTPNFVEAAGWAQYYSCHGSLNSEHYFFGYPDVCDVILHEAGHAIGIPHSTNKTSIMFPIKFLNVEYGIGGEIISWGGIDARCLRPLPSGARRFLLSRTRLRAESSVNQRRSSHGRSIQTLP